jgi:hypothetical protein
VGHRDTVPRGSRAGGDPDYPVMCLVLCVWLGREPATTDQDRCFTASPYFAATSPSSVAVNFTVDTKGGFLYTTFTFHPRTGAVTNGKVTGGTGAFTGATGTIKVKTISSTKHVITITYSG